MKLIYFATVMFCFLTHAQERIEAEYSKAPNPQFIREQMLDLNGSWRLTEGGQVQAIAVPFPPQAKLSGVTPNSNLENLVYERELYLPGDWEGGLLHFEGVDYESEVYFNGRLVGRHVGGYDPFSFDVTSHLARGEKTEKGVRHFLKVVVKDSNSSLTQISGKQERVPGEGLIFYKNMSGLWKSVWIERAGPARIERLEVAAGGDGRFSLNAPVLSGGRSTLKARVILRFENQEVVADETVPVAGGKIQVDKTIRNVKTWSPDLPSLYFLEVQLLGADGSLVDKVRSYTGFRTFEQRDGHFYLNGEAFQLRGVLDQVIYPDSLFTPTEADMIRDITAMKAAGFNGARIHQTTPSHRRLWLADRIGFWSSIELPSARNLMQEENFSEALNQWDRILKAYSYSRPTVFYVVPSNEDWGWLEDLEPGAAAAPEVREKVQHTFYRRTRAAIPKGMIISPEDGWRQISARKNGRPVPGLDSRRLMAAIHDYRTADDLRITYSPLPGYTLPGTAIPEGGKAAFLDGYEYDGMAAIVFSEAGGRAVTQSDNPKIFAYNALFRDAASWGREMSNVIVTLGALPVVRGGFVITQLRDAGNDPSDPDSTGELNGILTADGKEKIPAREFQNANLESYLKWKDNLRDYRQAANCQLDLASGDD